MIYQQSIKALYPIALAEGEGVGTAYEYFTKRLLLARWLKSRPLPRRIIVAGLPEKYGTSLDFLLLASELDAAIMLVDDRPQALSKVKLALAAAQQSGDLQNIVPEYCLVDRMEGLAEINGNFDLALSSETLQRVAADAREQYVSRLLELAPQIALFAPNNDNPAHTNLSGLSGLRLDELEAVVKHVLSLAAEFEPARSPRFGYIDMPPFPPGLTRSDEQREQATSGYGEAIAMWGLGYYARIEKWLPHSWRRSKSHIVFALVEISQRKSDIYPT